MPSSSFQGILSHAGHLAEPAFLLDRANFDDDAIGELKIRSNNAFRIRFDEVRGKRKILRSYQYYEMICRLTGDEDGLANITYLVRLRIMTLIILIFTCFIFLTIVVLELKDNHRLGFSFSVMLALGSIWVIFKLADGRRNIVKKGKLFLEVLPKVIAETQLA